MQLLGKNRHQYQHQQQDKGIQLHCDILRQNADRLGFKPSFTIYDAADSKALIKTIIKDMNLDDKVYKASTVQSAISLSLIHI